MKNLYIIIKNIIFIFLLSSINECYGRYSTVKIAAKISQQNIYDSTQNFVGKDAYKYIGQELYLMGNSNKNSYLFFFLDYTKPIVYYNSKEGCTVYNIYKYDGKNGTIYDEIARKIFIVIDVIDHPESSKDKYYDDVKYLKLKENENDDTIYYEYHTDNKYYPFPFIVLGYYKKLKSEFVSKKYVFSKTVMHNQKDMENGKDIEFKAGEIWTCKDLTLEDKFYSLEFIFENNSKNKILVNPSYFSENNKYAYSISEEKLYTNKFGKEIFNLILEEKVKIGMSKEMCELSWGYPNKINQTITVGKKTEQWVYDRGYLYFVNDKLATIQQ